MAISRKSAAEYANEIEGNILDRDNTADTKVGPIPDLIIQPLANVLELQNERIRSVQSLLSLVNDGSFTDSDMDDFVYNELIKRLVGAKARTTLIFSRLAPPTVNITIKANFPVATLPDESTNTSTTFLTLVDTTMVAANALSYYNPNTNRYELPVVAEALLAAETTNVAANRITRPLRPLVGFDSVFNRDPATGGKDAETNPELTARYYLSLIGSSPAVVNGLQKILRDQFTSVVDSNEVFGNNPLNVRAATDGGALDVYIIGTSPITFTETIIFTGVEQVIPLSKQPIISLSAAGAYIQGTDFILVKDTSGNRQSVRGADGIKWLSTGSAPAVGAAVSVTYVYNALMQQLQDGFTQSDRLVPGRDILFKAGDQIDITLSANLKIRSGFSVSTVLSAVTSAILALINDYKLGADVELSDIQAVVRAFSSVDNFVITNIAEVGNLGSTDIAIGDNEFARMASADLIISII